MSTVKAGPVAKMTTSLTVVVLKLHVCFRSLPKPHIHLSSLHEVGKLNFALVSLCNEPWAS